MYALVLGSLAATMFISRFILLPCIKYFLDRKGFRKYHNMNAFAGLTDLAFMWEVRQGFRSRKLAELHKIYDVVRTGPNALSYAGGEAIKDIYGHGSPCIKDDFYKVLAGTHFHLADVVDKPEHARKRKVLSSAYALKNLEGWEHKVADTTQRFLKACDTHCTLPMKPGFTRPDAADLTFDYRAYTNFFSLCAIANIGLSEDLAFLDQGNDICSAEKMNGFVYSAPFRQSLHSTARAQTELVWCYSYYKFFEKYSRYVSPRLRRLWKNNENWNDIILRRATQRLRRYQAGEKLDDFFQALMEDKNGNLNNLEWGEIVAEVSIMMNAGSDTTAIAMNNVMYNLLKNPEKLAKLREEIDSVLGPDVAVAPYDTVKHLPYLRACLDESLRLIPPTTFGLPRKTPAEGHTIAGTFVPGNTTVAISAYVAHRDPKVFPDPERFQPERWLGEAGKELQPYFISFSAGARGCIGRNISYLEQTVLLSSVVHRYEFALPHEGWEQERFETTNLSPGVLPLKVWRRELDSSLDEKMDDE